MKVLDDHYETMKSFISLVEKGKMDKLLVETLCSPSLIELNTYLTKILKDNNIVSQVPHQSETPNHEES